MYDFINTYLLSVQHKLRSPTRQELPGEYAVFQFAVSKTLKQTVLMFQKTPPVFCFVFVAGFGSLITAHVSFTFKFMNVDSAGLRVFCVFFIFFISVEKTCETCLTCVIHHSQCYIIAAWECR